MRLPGIRILAVLVALLMPCLSLADNFMIENFEQKPETRWRFFTDGVMGGVSSGQVTFIQEGDQAHAHLTGQVSTENNGGFIQMRTDLPDGAPQGAIGVRLVVRGNDQRYFVHLRTSGTVLPWQYYQAAFDVTHNWSEVRLPFDSFRRSGPPIRAVPRAQSLSSVAVVAYGRDHEAEVDARELGFY